MTIAVSALPETRNSLRCLANDCRERVRRADSETARLLFHDAARQCEQMAGDRFASIRALQETLEAMRAQAVLARWHNGEAIAFASQAPATPPPSPAPPSAPARPPEGAFNARQLSARFGVPERTARRTIERLVIDRRPGFYGIPNGERTRWFADPDAYAREWP